MQDLQQLHARWEPEPRPTHFALNYSGRQLIVCLKQNKDFVPNTYKGKPYTEMCTGLSLTECHSNYVDATTVFAGTMEDFDTARVAGEIVYSSEM